MFQQRESGLAGLAGLAGALMVLITLVAVAAPAEATSTPKPTVAEALVALYVPMQEALAGDSVASVKEQAAQIATAAAAAAKSGGDKTLYEPVVAAAAAMTAADIAGLREQFKPLSLALAHLVEKVAVAGHGIYFCPMADAYWIQKSGAVRNPYFGSKMLTCGEPVTKVEG
jgi:hypothetical protein